jgi:hypothetical protein
MSLVDLPAVKAWLNMGSDASDSKLQETIDAAEAYIARRIGAGSTLAAETITERVDGLKTDLILTTLPVISVTSVTGADGGTLTVASLDVNEQQGIIRYTQISSIIFPMPWYTVVYQAGFTALDFDYTQAVKEVTREFWGPQRGGRQNNPDQTSAMTNANIIIDNLPSYGFA